MLCKVMYSLVLLLLCFTRLHSALKYCVIGAGPGGVQIGYFLHKANRDYVIFERSGHAGSFYDMFPRHRKLISINKRHTGSTNKEFNLRHDWNSLLGDNDKMLFKEFSKEMFPPADAFVRYINSYVQHYNINIQYETEIKQVRAVTPTWFLLQDQHNQTTHCNVVISGTGLSSPNIPRISGIDLTIGYETMSTNDSDYEGKSVLILGRGNSAFETAQNIYGSTSYVNMIGRQRIRLAWETHYVGDVRAVNNEILDTYQLKSLDGLLDYGDLKDYKIVRKQSGLYLTDHDDQEAAFWEDNDNDPLQRPYDMIIRCLGFVFDTSIYNDQISRGFKRKYPEITPDYQSKEVPGLYLVGTATHSLDHRKSAGGFIHGFRYTARALHRILSMRYHNEHWPSIHYSLSQIVPVTIKRINEASGIYQMFGQLVDAILIDRDAFEYFEEFPLNLIFDFQSVTGASTANKSMLVVALEYGEEYHGPSYDVFRVDRAATDPHWAHLSNFLHPVIYFYAEPPVETEPFEKGKILPRPDRLLHLVEDFHTNWHHNQTHVKQLKTFIENSLLTRLDPFSDVCCLSIVLSKQTVPVTCKEYLKSL